MNRLKTFWKRGDSYVLLTGFGLVFSLLMVVVMFLIILVKGFGFFWPYNLEQIETKSGTIYLGQLWNEKTLRTTNANNEKIEIKQVQFKIGNRDLFGLDFKWLENDEIIKREHPPGLQPII